MTALRTPRAAILGWLKGELRRHESNMALFAADPARLSMTVHCLRRTYAARHYWKRHK